VVNGDRLEDMVTVTLTITRRQAKLAAAAIVELDNQAMQRSFETDTDPTSPALYPFISAIMQALR
jgi:hypothetical protein